MGTALSLGIGPGHSTGVQGGTDPYISNVEFLAGWNGADGATTFTDEGPDGRTVTFVGNAQLDTAQKKFGTASLLLDGTGDYCTAPDSVDWEFSGEFTVECFIRPTDINAGIRGFVSHYEGTAIAWTLYHNSSTVGFQFSTNGTTAAHDISAASSVAAASWQHIAVDRDAAGKIRLYVDGVMKASKTAATGTSAAIASTLKVGIRASSQPFNGHIDEVRITKGASRYASDGGFTPPSEAFPRP